MFVTATLLKLKRYLNRLRSVCYPPIETIRPVICVKEKENLDENDKLKYRDELAKTKFVPGTLKKKYKYGFAKPSELEEFAWWNTDDLKKEHDVDSISVGNKKWLFYAYDKIGQFFLEDGTRKVEIEFPAWMEMHKVFETDGVRAAVYNVLSKCTGKTTPNTTELSDAFSDPLCRAIFNNNPPQEAMEVAVLELYELLKKETTDYMETVEVKNIMASEEMAEFLQTHTYGEKTKDKNKVHQFLSGHLEFMFKYAKDLNLINNPDLLPFYKNIRDHSRHPDVKTGKINPQKVYEDFCAILNERPNYNSKAHKQSRLCYNTVLALQLETFSFLAGILDEWVDPEYKTGKDGKIKYSEKYFDDLVQKGILTEGQRRTFDNLRHRTAAIAHRDPHIRKNQPIPTLGPDEILQKIRTKLLKSHKRIDDTVLSVCDKIRKRQK